MKILIVGNPVDGMHFIGPFNNSEAACAVGEESGADWWITDLKSRADWREELVQQDEADWVVVNRNDPSLRWSNEHGWVEHGFDTFGAKERATLALPIEGKWEAFEP